MLRLDVYHHSTRDDCKIVELLQKLVTRSNEIMATVEQLNEAIAAANTAVVSLADTVAAEGVQVAAAIQALKDQIAAGNTGIDPALLDAPLANLANIATAAAAAKAAIEGIYEPDAPPV